MDKPVRILLVLAHSETKTGLFNKFVYTSYYPSITLEQLSSITPDQYEVEYVDERYESVDLFWKGTLVGISTLTPNAPHAYLIADAFRKRGKKVVLGGYHPSALPEEAKLHADAVVIGEAEISWPQLLRDFENGELKPFYRAPLVDPEQIPSPRRVPGQYPSIGVVQASRGCPYGCRFCAIQNVEGSRFRARPVRQVIEEIRTIESERFMFADSSLTINSDFTKALFQEMIGLNKKFSCYGNINVLQNDDELLDLARRAGCETWLVGFESINQDAIRHIGKSTNKVQEYASGIKKIRDQGMSIIGLFIFGFDTDTPNIFKATLNAVNTWKLDRAGFAILTPFPGTIVFDDLDIENRIFTRDWAKYNLRNIVYYPKNMSVKQLFSGRNYIAKKFYSLPNCLRRSVQEKNLTFDRFLRRTAGDFLLNRYFQKI
ncbi:MAG: B12-binding domain-containing radical SAM protein [Candidatus Thermoplasmatota archaeon]|nr:B12-binding domain-containing radical SAM protein [Candidatus Thermoplasmatota archaeon]MBU1940461.1 B12-binding domain-containing radical SAM protein [Candidatus Thermoplasmatota archaeon]